VPEGRPSDWSRDVFPRFLAEGLPLFGCVLDGYWCDAGSFGPYRAAQRAVLDGAVRAAPPGTTLRPGVWVGSRSPVVPGATLVGPALLGAGCRIEAGACILPGTVLGDGVIVRRGARIAGATLGAGCEVGPRAMLGDCVLDEEVRVGENCRIGEGTVIGRGYRLAAGVCVDAEQRLAPGPVLDNVPLPTRGTPRDVPRLEKPAAALAACCERRSLP
jgi:mannose-1-phosphate guanylyltransferase/phosphomannomutase